MDAKLNHSDLSALLAKEAGMSLVKAELFTKALFDIIIEGLEQDGVVKINGLGTFKLTDVASRSSVNVNTGEKFEIKGHKKLIFTPADTLKDCINQPFAMFEPVEVDETYSDDNDEENNDLAAEENSVVEDVQAEENEAVADVEEVVAEETVVEETVVADVAVAEEEKKIEEETAQADEVTEQTVAEQPKRPEPVMVHVPKKEKKQFAVPENKGRKSYKWLYAVLSVFAICAVMAVIYFVPSKQTETVAKEEVAVVEGYKADAVTGATIVEETVAKNEHKTDAVTGATVDATSGATPQDKELVSKEESLNELVAEEKVAEEYKFVVTEELASLDLKNVTVADTLQYEVAGVWVEHKVVAQETLTRIALKYYGDKKLWPYIVKYNSLTRPDDLRKGMKLLIPKLIPAN